MLAVATMARPASVEVILFMLVFPVSLVRCLMLLRGGHAKNRD